MRVRRSRRIAASPQVIWRVVADPHALPRWWPRVSRVEGAERERWTQVIFTRKGKGVRVDFRLEDADRPRRYAWRQELEGSPFERVLSSAEWDASLSPAEDGATLVTLETRQSLRGWARLGGWMFRRAAGRQLEEALDGLEHAVG